MRRRKNKIPQEGEENGTEETGDENGEKEEKEETADENGEKEEKEETAAAAEEEEEEVVRSVRKDIYFRGFFFVCVVRIFQHNHPQHNLSQIYHPCSMKSKII